MDCLFCFCTHIQGNMTQVYNFCLFCRPSDIVRPIPFHSKNEAMHNKINRYTDKYLPFSLIGCATLSVYLEFIDKDN